MTYNPNVHHRRSIRLKGYDYSQDGLYFLTICVQNKHCLFGKITDGKMVLNDTGQMVSQCWLEIPQHFPDVVLHEFVIMPNHVHGIIELMSYVGAKNFSPENNSSNENSPENNSSNENSPENNSSNDDTGAKNFSPLRGTSRTIGSIIRGFKIGVTKQLGYSVWQRNYYEQVIRNEPSYQNIADYIIHNPAIWGKDKFYLSSQQ